MKKLLLILALASAASSALRIIIAGQSNAMGWGDTVSYETALDNYCCQLTNGGVLRKIVDPFDSGGSSSHVDYDDTTKASIAVRLANILQPATNDSIIITGCALGGSGLVYATANNWGQRGAGSLAQRLIDKYHLLGGCDYIVWMQGETDAYYGVSYANYKSYLQSLIQLWKDSIPNVKIILVPMGRGGLPTGLTNDAQWWQIRQAQIDLDNGTDILTLNPQMDIGLISDDADAYHYTTSGLKTIGSRVGNAIKYSLGLSGYYKGPIAGTPVVSNFRRTITIPITTTVGSITASNVNALTGFRVVQSGVSFYPESAYISGSNVVLRYKNPVNIGTTTVGIIDAAKPSITSILKGTDSLALPLQSYEKTVTIDPVPGVLSIRVTIPASKITGTLSNFGGVVIDCSALASLTTTAGSGGMTVCAFDTAGNKLKRYFFNYNPTTATGKMIVFMDSIGGRDRAIIIKNDVSTPNDSSTFTAANKIFRHQFADTGTGNFTDMCGKFPGIVSNETLINRNQNVLWGKGFAANTGWVSLTNDTSFSWIVGSPRSLRIWFRPTVTIPSLKSIFSKYLSSGSKQEYFLYTTGNTSIYSEWTQGGETYYQTTNATGLTSLLNRLTCLTVTWDGTAGYTHFKIYDGKTNVVSGGANSGTPSPVNTTSPIEIGAADNAYTLLSDYGLVEMYNKELSAGEVNAYYDFENNADDVYTSTDSINTVLAIDSIRPSSGKKNDTINIYGNYFGYTQGSSTLAMGDSTPTVYAWGNTLIRIRCPNFADTGHYDFIVTDGTQSDTALAAFNYLIGPTISAQPADTTVCIGGTATFRLTATGTGTLSYQWSRFTGVAWGNQGTNQNSYSYTAAAGNNGDSIKCAVTDNNGTTTSSKVILTVTQLPAFTYGTNPATYTSGTAISTNSVSSSGGTITGFSGSVAPGLALNLTTGAVTGTPAQTSAAATAYYITATNCSGNKICTLTITINPAKPAPAYSGSPFSDSTGSAATHAMQNTGGAGVVSVRTALPKGYSINSSTGTITKTATDDSIHAETEYVVVDSNVTGKDSATITITVAQGRPIWSWVTNPLSCKVGIAIARDSAISTNGVIDSFKVVGTALPASIAIAKLTGTITGTIAVTQAAKVYTIRAWSSTGYRDITITIGSSKTGTNIFDRIRLHWHW